MPKAVYTIPEALRLIGKSPAVIWYIIQQYNIPYSVVDGKLVINLRAFDTLARLLGLKPLQDEFTFSLEVELHEQEETTKTETEELTLGLEQEDTKQRGSKKDSRGARNKR